jgi:NADH dehydrogenase
VQPDLSLPGHPEVFVIGDLAALKDENGRMLPGVAPVAMQQGRFVAKLIRKELEAHTNPSAAPFSRPMREEPALSAAEPKGDAKSKGGDFDSRPAFHYWDKGSLATIGRAAAIAEFGKIHISGFLAWLAWLFIHIMYLVGFRNRLLVMIQWAWSYVTYERGARLITGSSYLPGWTNHQAGHAGTAKSKPQEFPAAARK